MNPFEFPDEISRYSELHSSEESQELKDLFRFTHLHTVHPQMLSGRVQGQFLSMLSKLMMPKRILEIGTFTGYSAYCLASGLAKGGKLITIEINEELEDAICDFFSKCGLEEKVRLMIGDAREIIPSLDDHFDMIFIDANKEHYLEYYDAAIEKLNKGGLMIADNVLWGGKVVEEDAKDESTRILQEFNRRVQKDSRVENVFLTVRDGIMLIRKL